ncbi:MAG: hypothetical protein V8S24_11670, partial [Gordonibacter pamelaeae]
MVGTFPPASQGINIRVEGKFQTRTTYGKQFVAEKVWVSAPSKLEGIKKFLGSGLISGWSRYGAIHRGYVQDATEPKATTS